MGKFEISGEIKKADVKTLESKLTAAGYENVSKAASIFDDYDTSTDKGTLDISEQFNMAKELGLESASYKDKTHERKAAGIKVTLDDVWGKESATRPVAKEIMKSDGGYAEIKDISKYPTADEVLDKLLQLKGINDMTDAAKAELKADFIKYNISMFNQKDGTVLLDADWSKLDFPTVEDITNEYLNGEPPTDPPEDGQVTDVSKDKTGGDADDKTESKNTLSAAEVAKKFKTPFCNDNARMTHYYKCLKKRYINENTIVAILDSYAFYSRENYNNYDVEHRHMAVQVFTALARAIVNKAEQCGISSEDNKDMKSLSGFCDNGKIGNFSVEDYKYNKYSDGKLYDVVMPKISSLRTEIKKSTQST